MERLIVRCSGCGVKNRVPKNRIDDRPVCGRCKTPLSAEHAFPEAPVDVTDRTFPGEVLNFAGPVLVFIWAPWCGHCRKLIPVVDQIAAFYLGTLKVAKVELEPNPSTASRYQIQGVPALLFFKSGRLVDKIVGALPREEIERRLRGIL